MIKTNSIKDFYIRQPTTTHSNQKSITNISSSTQKHISKDPTEFLITNNNSQNKYSNQNLNTSPRTQFKENKNTLNAHPIKFNQSNQQSSKKINQMSNFSINLQNEQQQQQHFTKPSRLLQQQNGNDNNFIYGNFVAGSRKTSGGQQQFSPQIGENNKYYKGKIAMRQTNYNNSNTKNKTTASNNNNGLNSSPGFYNPKKFVNLNDVSEIQLDQVMDEDSLYDIHDLMNSGLELGFSKQESTAHTNNNVQKTLRSQQDLKDDLIKMRNLFLKDQEQLPAKKKENQNMTSSAQKRASSLYNNKNENPAQKTFYKKFPTHQNSVNNQENKNPFGQSYQQKISLRQPQQQKYQKTLQQYHQVHQNSTKKQHYMSQDFQKFNEKCQEIIDINNNTNEEKCITQPHQTSQQQIPSNFDRKNLITPSTQQLKFQLQDQRIHTQSTTNLRKPTTFASTGQNWRKKVAKNTNDNIHFNNNNQDNQTKRIKLQSRQLKTSEKFYPKSQSQYSQQQKNFRDTVKQQYRQHHYVDEDNNVHMMKINSDDKLYIDSINKNINKFKIQTGNNFFIQNSNTGGNNTKQKLNQIYKVQ